jgi:hypothetical protein
MDTSLAALRVREVLRSAGFREWSEGRRGWLVEGDPQGGWVVVTCSIRGARGNRRLQEYQDILLAAGFEVKPSPRMSGVLRVTIPDEALHDC